MGLFFYTTEIVLPPVRWMRSSGMLQQEWLIEDYTNAKKIGVPYRTRREWRNVPVVEET